MKDDLRYLKESLDDTYFKDMELSKSLKKKILKKATAQSRPSRIVNKLSYMTSLVLAASLLIILAVSFMKTDTNQASMPTIREQQVALIHLQDDVVQLVKKQQQSEGALLSSMIKNKPIQQLELQRRKVISDGEIIIESLRKMPIPSELSSNGAELTKSFDMLATAYEQKNKYYKELDVNDAPSLSPYNVPVDEFIYFEEMIGEVYKNVNLLPPSFQVLLKFLMWGDEFE
ncbi:hypothetical protein [Bacillus sp. FJAT-29814]|uniref:hypothetical protein n=1 Tax=Bacillus sp. FJAT-29814 TaxID=1729688 RepID=UPI0008321C5F|nr:hypothetical protein [Bacillus sp. FJAT-29814]